SVSQLEDSFYSAVETLAAESQKSGTDKRGTAKVADWSGIEALALPFVAAFQPYFRDDPKFGRVSTEKALGRLGIADQPQPSLEELRQFCVSSTRIAPSQDTANRAQEDLVALPEYSSVAAWSRRENPWSDATSSRLIIQLVGHDGGVWDISESEVHPCSAHDAARFVAFVTTASVWNVLCRHPEQLDEMLRKGSLLIERTVHEFGSAVSSVDEAIERLRRCLRKIAERLSLVPDSEEAGNVR
ncbi:MAG: hypothetical protein JNM43_01665, partial [Planctomycetaceae bacterium]|nr:hypothetical protein [Planctomycetaceae bacterium]